MAVDLKRNISNPNALDIGNVAVQGSTVSKTVQFSLFTANANAVWAAKQQLMKESYPFAQISVPVNRDLFRLEVGECFKFSYAPYGVSNMVLRVLLIEEEALDSEIIIVHAMEDFYSVTNSITEYSDPQPIPTPISPYILSSFEYQTVVEAPYLVTSDVGVIPIASRMSSVDLGMFVHLSFDGGVSYLQIGAAANLRPYGKLVGDYPVTYTIDDTLGFTIDFVNADVNVIETISWPNVLAATNNNAMLGDELLTFQSITPVSATRYKLEMVIRGRLDTEKVEHLNGEGFYFVGPFNMTFLQHPEISAGAARKFKLVPYNAKSAGDLSEADVIDLSVVGRARKPYTPTNFFANGENFVSRYVDDIVLTWTPRYRGRGAGIGVPGEVLSDTEREGFFEIEVWADTVLVRTVTAIDAVTWTYTLAMNIADNGAGLANEIVFKLLNYRTESGFVHKSDQVNVMCNKE